MKILISNLILYTSETREVVRASTIKDTMIYDLCLAFKKEGHDVTLLTAEDYKPTQNEEYPFKVIWAKSKYKKVFMPCVFPYCPETKKIAKDNFDLIISSEVISMSSLMLVKRAKDHTIIWQELSGHNKIYHGLVSKFWYYVIAKLYFKDVVIVPRSNQAREFISQFCNKVVDETIDHGVNSEIFKPNTDKENFFAVCSRLVKLKHIDKTIKAFNKYIKKYDNDSKLYIIGDGDCEEKLKALVNELEINDNVIFTGRLFHKEMVRILSKAKAMLIYTSRDLNMVSIVESLALATPIITTSVPFSSAYIKSKKLGIVNDEWNEDDLYEISLNNYEYVNKCLKYSKTIPYEYKVKQFIDVYNKYLKGR